MCYFKRRRGDIPRLRVFLWFDNSIGQAFVAVFQRYKQRNFMKRAQIDYTTVRWLSWRDGRFNEICHRFYLTKIFRTCPIPIFVHPRIFETILKYRMLEYKYICMLKDFEKIITCSLRSHCWIVCWCACKNFLDLNYLKQLCVSFFSFEENP